MPITFNGTKLPQSQIDEITKEIYSNWGTFRDKIISINEKHKSGAEVYESRVTVAMQAYSSGAVTAGGMSLITDRSPVTLTKIQFSDVLDNNTLLDTRFQRSMKNGAFNMVSTEFDNYVLQDISPAIGQTMENVTWDGATTATKAAIAALVPGAGQGSISAGAQTLVAAMPTNLVNSLPTTILYNNSQSKTVPGAGLGDYKKVLSIAAITASTIAAEYGKLYLQIDPKLIASKNKEEIPQIFAPVSHRQLMKQANNSVGAASNQNFTFSGDGLDADAYYNGIKVNFVSLVGFMIACPPKYLKVLMDLSSDMYDLATGPVANGAEQTWYKNVQAYATWVTNQRYIVLYGG